MAASAFDYLDCYAYATDVQARRIEAAAGDPFRLRVEAFLFLHAANNADRAAKMALNAATESQQTDEITAALNTFDAASPRLKLARDALEHFDAYAIGEGRHGGLSVLGLIEETKGQLRLLLYLSPKGEWRKQAAAALRSGERDAWLRLARDEPVAVDVQETAAALRTLTREVGNAFGLVRVGRAVEP